MPGFIEYLLYFAGMIVAAYLCIVSHEVAHGYVALLNGDETAKVNGRLTFNPAAHFNLVGFLLFLLVKVGYAKPVPVNPYYYKRRKLGIVTVSVAGVAVNLLTAFFAVPLFLLVLKFEAAMTQTVLGGYLYTFLESFLRFLIVISINLALFNVLPLYPLDGYHLLEGLFGSSNRVLRFLRDYGQYILLGFVLFGILVEFFGLPAVLSPWYWYMGFVGGKIESLFISVWLPLF